MASGSVPFTQVAVRGSSHSSTKFPCRHPLHSRGQWADGSRYHDTTMGCDRGQRRLGLGLMVAYPENLGRIMTGIIAGAIIQSWSSCRLPSPTRAVYPRLFCWHSPLVAFDLPPLSSQLWSAKAASTSFWGCAGHRSKAVHTLWPSDLPLALRQLTPLSLSSVLCPSCGTHGACLCLCYRGAPHPSASHSCT